MRVFYRCLFALLTLAILSVGAVLSGVRGAEPSIGQWDDVNRPARIHPDYCGIEIPPNIAPLNFLVLEQGLRYRVKIYSKQGKPIETLFRTPKIIINENSWHELLGMNQGEELYFDVFVQTSNERWVRFQTITNRIARENIDDYVVYRKMHPTHVLFNGPLGIYQRNLRGFDESVILDRGYHRNQCLNCHTFCNNHSEQMLIGVRNKMYGVSTLLVEDSVVSKIGTKFGYTSWHPSGHLAVFSINDMRLFWHTSRNEVRDTVNVDSALAYYVVDSKTVKTAPNISRKDRLETWPRWSPDGRYLYFCSQPKLWSDVNKIPPEHYEEIRYDIVRISYDIDRDQWGELETVISAQDTHLSALVPRISPDGRWLLFCMCDCGYFPAWEPSSDFYLVDLKTAKESGHYQYRRLEINSDQSESWCSWSSNSRWIVFSSKRGNPTFTRLYLSYVDEDGKVYKPFVLPQKDPAFYDSCLKTYNTPELVIGPVKATGEKLARAIRGSDKISVDMPITGASPKTQLGVDYGQKSE
jgi:Tol biopolymer transport system component